MLPQIEKPRSRPDVFKIARAPKYSKYLSRKSSDSLESSNVSLYPLTVPSSAPPTSRSRSNLHLPNETVQIYSRPSARSKISTVNSNKNSAPLPKSRPGSSVKNHETSNKARKPAQEQSIQTEAHVPPAAVPPIQTSVPIPIINSPMVYPSGFPLYPMSPIYNPYMPWMSPSAMTVSPFHPISPMSMSQNGHIAIGENPKEVARREYEDEMERLRIQDERKKLHEMLKKDKELLEIEVQEHEKTRKIRERQEANRREKERKVICFINIVL
jgi:hypothetical protein